MAGRSRLRGLESLAEEAVSTGAGYSTGVPPLPSRGRQRRRPGVPGPGRAGDGRPVLQHERYLRRRLPGSRLGTVLGVEDNTGAGGANVVTHEDLRTEWTGGPLKRLPKGVQMRVALRRCLRVLGTRSGQPVEDLGVVPDQPHPLAISSVTSWRRTST